MLPRGFFALLCLAATALPGPVVAQDYAIGSGDRVTTQLFTAAGEEVSVIGGQRIVDRNGNVFLPFLGSFEVAGLDENELRDELTRRYGSFYDQPVVDVQVELRVNITGAVGNPGQFFLDPTATLTDAVSQAGGVGPEFAVNAVQIPADPGRVRLVRDSETQILNLRPGEVTDETLRMRIQSGDWIHVPFRQRSRVRDEIQFWGSLVSFAASIVGLVVLIQR